jgi:hypothetical protein
MSQIRNTMALAFVLLMSVPESARAAGAWYDVFAWFSSKQIPATDEKGNPIFDTVVALDELGRPIRDQNGNPVFNKIAKYVQIADPVGDAILRLGMDLTFDPSKIQVVTDLSTVSVPLPSSYGFLCDFSSSGNCPSPASLTLPSGFGDSLPGSTFAFNVNNVGGEVTLAYDFSSTPVTVTGHTNFFAFLFEPVVVGVVDPNTIYTLPANFGDPFTQHPESPAQYCTTQSTDRTGLQCTSIENSSGTPEPGVGWLLGSGLALLGLRRIAQRAMTSGFFTRP